VNIFILGKKKKKKKKWRPREPTVAFQRRPSAHMPVGERKKEKKEVNKRGEKERKMCANERE
jgi:hypothetical protein